MFFISFILLEIYLIISLNKLFSVNGLKLSIDKVIEIFIISSFVKKIINAYNSGPHPISIGLGLLGKDRNSKVVFCKSANTYMCSGDADDYVKIIIDTPNKPVLDIEINNTDSYTDYNIKLQGTRGTFKSNPVSYKCKYINEGENIERSVIAKFLSDENGNPQYCKEKLIIHEESGSYKGTAFDEGTRLFYEDVYNCIVNGGNLVHDAEDAKMVIEVIEKLHSLNPLEKKY